MTDKIILQNLRDFTVQIRRPSDDAIAGTGLVVSMEGQIVTCAHVVKDALGVHPREANDAEIGVYFPHARGDEVKARRATVSACHPTPNIDDAVILQLDGPPPLGPEQMPTLGSASKSRGHRFSSYGYAPVGNRLSRYADGKIMGPVETVLPKGEELLAPPLELRTENVRQGLSGAAVLDEERNLVVGLVTAYWLADGDPPNIAYATNGRVLAFDPLNLPLQDEPLPKKAAAQPQPQYREVAQKLAHVRPESQFHAAPPPLAEWVGRAELLASLTRDYADPTRRVTGLIGFGGEGKSSLARRWVDALLAEKNAPAADQSAHSALSPFGVFWWGFYDNQNVDQFFETALDFISGGRIDQGLFRSGSAKAQTIAAMLANGRYLFVLDGLEVLQQQEGDRYGLLTSPDLQHFLELFAAPGHGSFCLVTSRAPLLDLMAYTSYTHRDVGPVTPADGRALLRALGVQGRDDELDPVVAQWDGHALTLSLLGSYLAWRHNGDVAFAADFDPVDSDDALPADAPDAAKQRYAHVHRVLRRYDEHLSGEERAFMTLFSAFRMPVAVDAFRRIFPAQNEKPGFINRLFRISDETGDLQTTLTALDDTAVELLVARLVGYRLLRHNPEAATYTTHPLVRNHYLARLTGSGQAKQTHDQLKEYYLSLAGDTPDNPTMEQLAPIIEAIFHACRAGAYDKALELYHVRCQKERRAYITHNLGAYEADINIARNFFPNGDIYQEPLVSTARNKSYLINEVGQCLTALGRLELGVPFYERSAKIDLGEKNWADASIDYMNLALLNINMGRLAVSACEVSQALRFSHWAAATSKDVGILGSQAWIAHLRGEVDVAGEEFRQAEARMREVESNVQHLYGLSGIQHADHLRRTGAADYARRVTVANLEICERNRWANQISWCHRVLGELDADDGQHASARTHFDRALTIARGISFRPALIEALLARGRWAARRAGDDLPQAFSDLREALGYATDGGYRIYEADIRNGLGWAYLADGDLEAARRSAGRAKVISAAMGYHWGQVDADEVLTAVTQRAAE